VEEFKGCFSDIVFAIQDPKGAGDRAFLAFKQVFDPFNTSKTRYRSSGQMVKNSDR